MFENKGIAFSTIIMRCKSPTSRHYTGLTCQLRCHAHDERKSTKKDTDITTTVDDYVLVFRKCLLCPLYAANDGEVAKSLSPVFLAALYACTVILQQNSVIRTTSTVNLQQSLYLRTTTRIIFVFRPR